jgi:hypothetical protein
LVYGSFTQVNFTINRLDFEQKFSVSRQEYLTYQKAVEEIQSLFCFRDKKLNQTRLIKFIYSKYKRQSSPWNKWCKVLSVEND